jgi:hypothetical protein
MVIFRDRMDQQLCVGEWVVCEQGVNQRQPAARRRHPGTASRTRLTAVGYEHHPQPHQALAVASMSHHDQDRFKRPRSDQTPARRHLTVVDVAVVQRGVKGGGLRDLDRDQAHHGCAEPQRGGRGYVSAEPGAEPSAVLVDQRKSSSSLLLGRTPCGGVRRGRNVGA